MIEAVEREYEVSREQASRDVVEFLNELSSVGLVEACPSAPDLHAQLLADVVAG
jgi:hypothetical protein